MTTRYIPADVKRLLYHMGGNRCYCPGCGILMNLPSEVRGEVAHNIPFSPSGPRSEFRSISDDVNAISNLLLLCIECHNLVDQNPTEHPPGLLREWKERHESQVGEKQAELNYLSFELSDLFSDPTTPDIFGRSPLAVPAKGLSERLIREIQTISSEATRIVVEGDYEAFGRMGVRLVSLAEGLSDGNLSRRWKALGLYWKAEGLRLLGDLRAERSVKDDEATLDAYRDALEFDQESPSIIRGLGKAFQNLECYDEAREFYRDAMALAKSALDRADGRQATRIHELLRISRHAVHNELAGTQSNDRLLDAAREWGKSKDLHEKYLAAFSGYSEWAATEAFMGYTFLGSTASKIGTSDGWKGESARMLAEAMRNRLRATYSATLTRAFHQNIRWWAGGVSALLPWFSASAESWLGKLQELPVDANTAEATSLIMKLIAELERRT